MHERGAAIDSPRMSDLLWAPSHERIARANITRFIERLKSENGVVIEGYDALYDWSVTHIPEFWEAVWRFAGIVSSAPYSCVLEKPVMPGARWFDGARLNFAENLLRYRDDKAALISVREGGTQDGSITYAELYRAVARMARFLRACGVEHGDRVAGFMPNRIETVVAMLATTSLGAIWSSCSPDFGFNGVMDRFGQIRPKVLVAADGYFYNGKAFDCLEKAARVAHSIDSITRVVVVPFVSDQPDVSSVPNGIGWSEALANDATEIEFAELPFRHPLYIMYSSGTTGVPKCIVHGAGGTLLQHAKELHAPHGSRARRRDLLLHDLRLDDVELARELAVHGRHAGAVRRQPRRAGRRRCCGRWRQDLGITVFGTSAKFIGMCEKAGVQPGSEYDLTPLRAVLSTGSPLSIEGFEWVYREVKPDLQLASISGGTDIVSCFMLGSPISPVYAGEIQKRGLGMKVEAWNESGEPGGRREGRARLHGAVPVDAGLLLE